MTEVEAAIGIIERLEEIASNEMLIRGTYIEDTIIPSRPNLRDAPCGGRRACMVGSFFLASGVSYSDIRVWIAERNAIAEKILGMKMARKALNLSSLEHPDYPYDSGEDFYNYDAHDPMEVLFEDSDVAENQLGPLVHEVCEKALEKLRNT